MQLKWPKLQHNWRRSCGQSCGSWEINILYVLESWNLGVEKLEAVCRCSHRPWSRWNVPRPTTYNIWRICSREKLLDQHSSSCNTWLHTQETQKTALQGLSSLKSELEEKKSYVLSLQDQIQQQILCPGLCADTGTQINIHIQSCMSCSTYYVTHTHTILLHRYEESNLAHATRRETRLEGILIRVFFWNSLHCSHWKELPIHVMCLMLSCIYLYVVKATQQ